MEQRDILSMLNYPDKPLVDFSVSMANLTAQELQQTMVNELKAANADNKLSKEEIEKLGILLLEKTKEKLSVPTYNLLDAAGVDIEEIIRGADEAWVQAIKSNYYPPVKCSQQS